MVGVYYGVYYVKSNQKFSQVCVYVTTFFNNNFTRG